MSTSRYAQRGVSSDKEDVHKAIATLDKGLFPKAFCKVVADTLTGSPDHCIVMHADGAGTKSSLAYAYWKETGDLSVWHGIAQDAIVMNLDDLACVGCVDNLLLSSTIGRNKNLIPGEVLAALIGATSDFAARMAEFGVHIQLAGGETADVGDIVRTIDVGYTAFGRLKRSELIVNDIQAGDVIVGLASYGQASYEDAYNGGMGSNGLTSARHDVLANEYARRFPETYDPQLPADLVYAGSRKLTDLVKVNGTEIPVGKLILSPTRTYLPVLKAFLEKHRSKVHGMIHCTGGGQTKVLKFVHGKRIIKDNLFPLPPLFRLIQEESGTGWKEMYQVFNMGHRLEAYLPADEAAALMEIAGSLGVEARLIGHVEASEETELRLESPQGAFEYRI